MGATLTAKKDRGLVIAIRLTEEDEARFERHRARLEKAMPKGVDLITADVLRSLMRAGLDSAERSAK
jgi:hypothetical protein